MIRWWNRSDRAVDCFKKCLESKQHREIETGQNKCHGNDKESPRDCRHGPSNITGKHQLSSIEKAFQKNGTYFLVGTRPIQDRIKRDVFALGGLGWQRKLLQN
jgi:hypothetical protein